MLQSPGLTALGLFEVGEPSSPRHVQNPSLSPFLTSGRLKTAEGAAEESHEFTKSHLTGILDHAVDQRVAIIGMALKMPGAESPGELWHLINGGAPTSTTIPLGRFDTSSYSDERKRGVALKAGTGSFVNGLCDFDNEFFSISPREAKMMDPQQRMLLHVAHEALDDAGFIPHSSYSSDPNYFGVFIGAATNDYVHNLRDVIDVHYISATLPAFLSGRISYTLSLGGPSTTYDTACSSSAVALHAAVRSLQSGDCRMALAGGVNAITSPDLFIGLGAAGFLSRTGQSRPFDAHADGYSRGEGCGLFVLKRISDALADNDRILGVIRGVESNQSYLNTSITRTHPPTQAALFRRLLEKSHLQPADIDVVEAHAAGTKQGDTSELLAIRDVFLEEQAAECRQAPLYVSSIKASIGHLEAASGAASLAKVLLMLQHQLVPRQIGVRQLNSVMDSVSPSQMTIPVEESAPWLERVDRKPRRAVVNNYGAAGSNVSILVEEYVEQPQPRSPSEPASTMVLGLSARSEPALFDLKKRYIEWLHDPSKEGSLLDFCYTSTARRQLYTYRLSITTPSSKEDLVRRLEESPVAHVRPGVMDVVFVYPGQGSQCSGMGRVLYKACPTFKKSIDGCDATLTRHGFPTILPYLLEVNGIMVEGSSVIEHTALLSFVIALSKLWLSWGISPSAVIGHSLGEYAALVASKVLSLEDALLLVARRAQLIEERCTAKRTGMMVVSLPSDTLQGILQASGDFADLAIACRNSQHSQTVAGPLSQLRLLETKLRTDNGVTPKLLPAGVAYHSPAMLPVIEGFADAMKDVDFSKAAIPCASTVTGTLLSPRSEPIDTTHLLRHCLDPVQFTAAVSSLATALGATGNGVCWIEVSPRRTLLPLVRTIIPDSTISHVFLDAPIQGSDPWPALTEGLSFLYTTGVPVQWEKVFPCLGRHRCISLPPYPFQPQSFYVPYREPSSTDTFPRDAVSSRKVPPSPPSHSPLLTLTQAPSMQNGRSAVFIVSRTHINTYSEAHRVASVAMCPASAYLEAVISGVSMARECLYGPEKPSAQFSLTHLEFLKPFVSRDHPRLSVALFIRQNEEGSHDFNFRSHLSGKGHTRSPEGITHASGACLRLENAVEGGLLLDLDLPYILRRIERLNPATLAGIDVFSSKSVYDVIFPRIVEYASPFRSLQRVVVAEDRSEGHAFMQVPATAAESPSVLHPAYLDPALHLPGFILNLRAGQDDLLICIGIGSVDLIPSAFIGPTFQVHTTISPLTKDVWVADTVVLALDSSKIVARLKNIQFKKISRRVLISHLSPSGELAALSSEAHSPEPLSPISLPSRSLSRRLPAPTPPRLTFKAILSSALHIPERTIMGGSTLAALGLDSLASIGVIHSLQREYDPALPNDFFQKYVTVEEVENALRSEPVSLSRDNSTRSIPRAFRCLEQIQDGPSTKVPICFIHDGSGSVDCYERVEALGRKVWAIKILDSEVSEWETIEEMAEFYAGAISSTLADGVILSGWSFGGVVAFEVAKQLLASGANARGLVLLDAPPPTGQVLLSSELMMSIASKGSAEPGNPALKQLERHVQMVSRYRGTGIDSGSQLRSVYLRCVKGYQASAKVTIDGWFSIRDDLSLVAADWEGLLGKGMHIIDVPGHHFEMLGRPRIDSTSAAVLQACGLLDGSHSERSTVLI